MADKKGDCGCGCIGRPNSSSETTDDKKESKKSK